MRQFPTQLADALSNEAITACWCWRVTLKNGTTIRFTDHDTPLSLGGEQYEPANSIDVSVLESGTDLNADNLSITGLLDVPAISAQDLHAGLLNHADVEIFVADWSNPSAHHRIMKGSIGEVIYQNGNFTADLIGASRDLNRKSGRILSRTCDANLGDARCRKDITGDDNFNVRAQITRVVAENHYEVSIAGAAQTELEPGWFRLGTLSAQIGGQQQSFAIADDIPIFSGRAIKLWAQQNANLKQGDSVTLTVGCDKEYATCVNRFQNQHNFRGFPHMPGSQFGYQVFSRVDNVGDGGSINE